jgi:homoserine O-acetyltransferase
MTAAAQAVKAHMLIIVDTQDHMVNPQPALAFAALLHVDPVVLDSDCGHLGPGCSAETVIPAVHRAIARQ